MTAIRPRLDADGLVTHDEAPVDVRAADMRPTEVDDWEILRELRAEVTLARADAATAMVRAEKAERWLSRGVKVLLSGLGAISIGVVAVLRLASASGERTATERQHQAEHVESRAAITDLRLVTVPSLRVDIAANAAAIAGLRGALEQISRLGAVRVEGPAVQPLLPPGDP